MAISKAMSGYPPVLSVAMYQLSKGLNMRWWLYRRTFAWPTTFPEFPRGKSAGQSSPRLAEAKHGLGQGQHRCEAYSPHSRLALCSRTQQSRLVLAALSGSHESGNFTPAKLLVPNGLATKTPLCFHKAAGE